MVVMSSEAQPDGSSSASLPAAVRLAGLVLALSAFLPFSPAGTPFWRLALEAFGSSVGLGLLVTFGFGAPFWLGLVFALAPRHKNDALVASNWTWRRLAQGLTSLMHAQLILVSWSIARAGVGIASWSLFGFALVSGLYFASASGRIAAEADSMGGAPPPARWITRWSCTIIVMVALWLRLQAGEGLRLGIALEAASLAAAFVVWRLSGRRASR
jgi:hypothetical protein